MVTVTCSSNRWVAHTEIANHFSKPGDDRDYLWRFIAGNTAEVKRQGEIDTPSQGKRVRFYVECVPVTKSNASNGRKKRNPLNSPQQAREWFIKKVDGLIAIDELSAVLEPCRISKSNGSRPFHRTSAFISGEGMVCDQASLNSLMNAGLGDAKAYGFGLLTLEEI